MTSELQAVVNLTRPLAVTDEASAAPYHVRIDWPSRPVAASVRLVEKTHMGEALGSGAFRRYAVPLFLNQVWQLEITLPYAAAPIEDDPEYAGFLMPIVGAELDLHVWSFLQTGLCVSLMRPQMSDQLQVTSPGRAWMPGGLFSMPNPVHDWLINGDHKGNVGLSPTRRLNSVQVEKTLRWWMSSRSPHLAHRLLWSAHDAAHSSDYRRSVIEAAMSVEIALIADLNAGPFSRIPPEVAQSVIGRLGGQAALRSIRKVANGDRKLQAGEGRVDALGTARNRAVHQGDEPENLADHLATAREVVLELIPLVDEGLRNGSE